MSNFLNTHATTEVTIEMGITKANFPWHKTFFLGIMGSMFVAFGCMSSIISIAVLGPGLGKFVGAFLFPVGLMMCVLVGGSLFTGDCLLGAALFMKKIKWSDFLKNLLIVWIGNFVGSLAISFIAVKAGLFTAPATIQVANSITAGKLALPYSAEIYSGILCNMLVAGAVWMSFASRDYVGKLFACWFPVMLFAYLGFQHVVANMTYFNIAYFIDATKFNYMDFITHSHIPVTIGNFISGALILPYVYGFLYIVDKKQQNN